MLDTTRRPGGALVPATEGTVARTTVPSAHRAPVRRRVNALGRASVSDAAVRG